MRSTVSGRAATPAASARGALAPAAVVRYPRAMPQYRVRISILEPAGVEATTVPASFAWPGRVLSRSEEVFDARVNVRPTDRAGESEYEVLSPRGDILEFGITDTSDARKIAAGVRLRRLLLVVEANADKLASLRSVAGTLGQQIATGQRSFLGSGVRELPATSQPSAGSGFGVLLGLVAIAGVFAYVNRSPSPALSAAPCAPCARKKK